MRGFACCFTLVLAAIGSGLNATLTAKRPARAVSPGPFYGVTFTSAPQRAQSPRACDRCQIQIRVLASVGRSTDAVLLADNSHLARRRDGWVSATQTHEPGTVAYFGPGGQYVRSDGRKGAGPGELSDAIQGAMYGPGDSLYVVDLANRRITISATTGLAHSRQVRLPLPFPQRVFPLDSGRVFLQGATYTPSTIGNVFHILSPDGAVRSFGAHGGVYDRGRSYEQFRAVTLNGSRTQVVAGRINKLEIETWSLNGEKLSTMLLRRGWFQEWKDLPRGVPFDVPPPPRLVGLWLENSNRLWMVVHVADRNWTRQPLGSGERSSSPAERNRQFDTMIEVVDATTGAAITAFRDDRMLLPTNTDGVFRAAASDRNGIVQVSLLQFHLSQRPGG